MKKLIFLTLIFLLFFLKNVNAADYVDFSLYTLSYSIEKKFGYDLINVEDYTFIKNTGEPQLPKKTFIIVIPPNAKVVSVDKIRKDQVTIEGTYDIIPTPEPVPLDETYIVSSDAEKDMSVYGKDEDYPKIDYEVKETYFFRGYKVAIVEVYPFKFNPVKKTVSVAKGITLRLNYKKTGPKPESISEYDPLVADFVYNYEQAYSNGWSEAMLEMSTSPTSSLPSGHYDYVLITDDTLASAAQPLIDWRNDLGIPSTLVNLSYIYSNYGGVDNADKVRNFIVDAYNTWGIKYVGLGGDVDIIPPRYLWDSLTLSDYYYAGLDGNWDCDGDGIYGESATSSDCHVDEADWYVEVFVGRLSVEDAEMMSTLATKIINFESSDFTTNNFLVLSAFVDGGGGNSVIVDMRNLAPSYYTVTGLSEQSGNLTSNNVVEQINSEYKLIYASSHGAETALGLQNTGLPFLSNFISNNINNPDKLGIFFAMACKSGKFDYSVCLGEKLVREIDSGVINYIGASEATVGNTLDYRFFREYFKGRREPAQALYVAKMRGNKRPEFNLIGDPMSTVKLADDPPSCWVYKPDDYHSINGVYRILVRAFDDNAMNNVKIYINDTPFDITSNYDGNYYYYDLDTTTLIEDGFYHVYANATDSASQITQSPTRHFKVDNVDNFPSCSIQCPSYVSKTNSPYEIEVYAEDDRGIEKVEISIDSDPYIDITNNYWVNHWYYNWDLTDILLGEHTIDARTTDTGFQITESHCDTEVTPTDPPRIINVIPANESVISEVYRIKVWAQDDVGLTNVEISLDSGEYINIIDNEEFGHFYYDWDTTTVPDGQHTIDVRAIDTDALTTNYDTIYVYVDNGEETTTTTSTTTSTSTTTPPLGGCPTLFVYDGKNYVKERKSRIHSEEGVDTVDEIVLNTKPVAENGVYYLSLKETTLPEHSYIDNVKLFVNGQEAKLMSAWHSKYGDVTSILEENDEIRTDTKLWDEIDLKFDASRTGSFVLKIEGYNPRRGGPVHIKIDVAQFVPGVIIATVVIIVVIFAVMKFKAKK